MKVDARVDASVCGSRSIEPAHAEGVEESPAIGPAHNDPLGMAPGQLRNRSEDRGGESWALRAGPR